MSKTTLAAAVLASLAAHAAPTHATPPSLDALAWMAGTWTGRIDGVEMEEVWLAPRGGLMLGVHRDVKDGKAVSYELLRIEAKEAGLVYTSIPNGKGATPFVLKSAQDRRAVFENPKHDFPQRILYWSPKDGELCARIEGKQGGRLAGEEWCWRR